MSILQPEIVKFGTRRYRKNPFLQTTSHESSLKPYHEETSDMFYENRCYDDETCNLDSNLAQKCTIEETCSTEGIEFGISKDTFKCVLNVAQSYFGIIIGKNGENKNKLERDTQTVIKTSKDKSGDWLSIEGKTKASVASCRNRIQIMIITARHQKAFTHMLTFPLNFDGMQAKLKEFKNQVIKTCLDDRGVDDSIFQYESKLHLTICTATLLSENEVDQAVRLLDECRHTFIKQLIGSKPVEVCDY
jgi:hypothetical protein